MAQEKLQKRYHKADVFLGLLSGKPAFLTGEKNSLTLCKWIWFNAYSFVGFLTKKAMLSILFLETIEYPTIFPLTSQNIKGENPQMYWVSCMSNTLLHALISPLYTSGVKEAGIFFIIILSCKEKRNETQ